MTTAAPYERKKEASRAREAEQSRSGRDIGDLPAVVNPERRARAERDFEYACHAYFPQTFTLPFCPDHKKAIAKIETAVLRGGLFALAMPRGYGKTSLAESAALWAVLYGHRCYVAIIGSSEKRAGELLDTVKTELETNDLLLEDFPEVCYPIRCLEGIGGRCKGQLYRGERTRILWKDKKLVLPTVPGSKGAAAVIEVAGIDGSIRGMHHKRADGTSIRPDLAIPDDPQTDESAASATECQKREKKLAGAVLGLAGPGKKIAAIMPLTVILPGDVADHLLDRKRHPEWQGERTRMVYAFPKAEKLWEKYAELRAESLEAGRGGDEATEFYRERRAEMEAGARVAWPEHYNPDELSALQHAMNLRLQDEVAFWAEYQNDPLPLIAEEAGELKADQVAARVNRQRRGTVPARANLVTAFVDVQKDLLFWALCAWEEGFTGSVVDYGTYPPQVRRHFRLRDARPTLSQATGIAGLEGSIYAGLDAVATLLLAREWRAEGGAVLKVERCLVDANWGQSTDVVHRFCRASAHAAVLTPSHGKGIGPDGNPITDGAKKPGEKKGLNWILPPARAGQVRRVQYDANFWKTFLAARLLTALGEKGALTLFGDKPAQHRLLAEHVTAEYRVRTTGRNREVDVWKLRPEKPDNHWLDCLVGCCVGASVQGAELLGAAGKKPGQKKRVSYAEMQAKARAGR